MFTRKRISKIGRALLALSIFIPFSLTTMAMASIAIAATAPTTTELTGFKVGSPGVYQLNGYSITGPAGITFLVGIGLENAPSGDFLSITNGGGVTASYGFTSGSDILTHFTQITFTGQEAAINDQFLNGFEYHSANGEWNDQIKVSVTVTEAVPGVAYYPHDNHYYRVGHFNDGATKVFCSDAGTSASNYITDYAAIETLVRKAKGSSNCTWSQANSLARADILKGRPGYLANITNVAENNFLKGKLQGALNVWIGGTDGASDGSTSTLINNIPGFDFFTATTVPDTFTGGTEGLWRYYDGPEKGQVFWRQRRNVGADWATWRISNESTGYDPGVLSNVTTVGEQDVLIYSHWADQTNAQREPNNSSSNPVAYPGEDNVVFNWNSTDGYWNDLNGSEPTVGYYGYVIEYGDSTPFSDTDKKTSTLTFGSKPSGSVLNLGAADIGQFGATLKGSINTSSSGTTAAFCYGLTADLTTCTNVAATSPATIVANTINVVKKNLTGLTQDTTYYYFVVSSDGGVDTKSSIRSFKTADSCYTYNDLPSGKRVIKFTQNSNCTWTVPAGVTQVEFVAVAGGGGGGSACVGGGGGAGGFFHSANTFNVMGTFVANVGAGGAGGTGTGCAHHVGSNGGDTVVSTGGGLYTKTLKGGGGGGYIGPTDGIAGGSGGGGSGVSGAGGASLVAGEGNSGGSGNTGTGNPGGGGGGASAVGGNATGINGGDGGSGFKLTINGVTENFAGGGGGGSDEIGGNGGQNCGGNGAGRNDNYGGVLEVATAATGYGCGGGGGDGASEATSGSNGVVYLFYPLASYSITYDANGGSGTPPMEFSILLGNKIYVQSGSVLSKSGCTFDGWNFNGSKYITGAELTVTQDVSLVANWTGCSGGSGGGGGSSPVTTTPQILPGFTWSPKNIYENEAISDAQLGAEFSVPGSISYSVPKGFKPKSGKLTIVLTFKPVDASKYLEVQITREIDVLKIDSNALKDIISGGSETQKQVALPELKDLGKIYFNNNEYFLDAMDRKSLKLIASKVKSAGFKSVLILGHSDIKKGVDNNWLSKSRADAVAKFFKQFQIKAKLTEAWFGPKRPAVKGQDKASLSLNRRVEIFLLN